MRLSRPAFLRRTARTRLPAPAVLLAVVLVTTLAGALTVLSPLSGPRTPAPLDGASSPDRAAVSSALATLTVIPRRVHVLGYSRDHFGGWAQRWWSAGDTDLDDTRHGALCSTRAIVMFTAFPGLTSGTPGACPSPTGLAVDVYTGDMISPEEVEVDHVVALSTAWDHGAWKWDRGRRVAFANDLDVNLLAVAGPVNQAKSDGTLGEWLPPTAETGSPSEAGCAYAARYLAVSVRYELTVSVSDAEAATAACGL